MCAVRLTALYSSSGIGSAGHLVWGIVQNATCVGVYIMYKDKLWHARVSERHAGVCSRRSSVVWTRRVGSSRLMGLAKLRC